MMEKEYRCFHCGEVFDSDAAQEHFGQDESHQPGCQINLTKYREMEALVAAYQREDTDLHKEIASLQSQLAVEVKRAEEQGYARGLADAKKYPHELGLRHDSTHSQPVGG